MIVPLIIFNMLYRVFDFPGVRNSSAFTLVWLKLTVINADFFFRHQSHCIMAAHSLIQETFQ